MSELLHATAVAIGERAVLILGEPGAGKSDLALRLIDRGATLVSDDQVALSLKQGRLLAGAPATIAGKMEVRGVGIVPMSYVSPMPVALVIELTPEPDRMPEPRRRSLAGIELPAIALAPFEASAPIKAEMALRQEGLAW